MINHVFVNRYVRCDRCLHQMLGIRSREARRRCTGCGGRALIGEAETRRDMVRRARERLEGYEPPSPTRRPSGRPYRGVAA